MPPFSNLSPPGGLDLKPEQDSPQLWYDYQQQISPVHQQNAIGFWEGWNLDLLPGDYWLMRESVIRLVNQSQSYCYWYNRLISSASYPENWHYDPLPDHCSSGGDRWKYHIWNDEKVWVIVILATDQSGCENQNTYSLALTENSNCWRKISIPDLDHRNHRAWIN